MSKIFKHGTGSEAVPLPLKGVAPPGGLAIQAFSFRQVGASKSAAAGQARPAGPEQRRPDSDPPLDLDAIRKPAYQQGYADGERDGAERVTAQFQSVMHSFSRTTEELAACKSSLRAEARDELVGLALAIARRVIHRELQVDPSAVLGIVRACLDRIDAAEIHRLRVNPADAGVVADFFRQTGNSEVEIVPDQSVRQGGAVLHTTQGQLDAQIESQLREIEYGLTDR